MTRHTPTATEIIIAMGIVLCTQTIVVGVFGIEASLMIALGTTSLAILGALVITHGGAMLARLRLREGEELHVEVEAPAGVRNER